MNPIVIIPARYASTRFPGKPLVDIGGITMIERVWRKASEAVGENRVIVATDNKQIMDVAKSFGAVVVMTSENHLSGTDRVFEAYQSSGMEGDVIINVQGDEPFIDPTQITQLISLFHKKEVEIATLVKPISGEEAQDTNRVKAVISTSGKALYFSRSIIPFAKNTTTEYLKHIGIYGYRPKVLEKLVKLPPSSLENSESLEQLRWLENDFLIYTAQTQIETPSVDTPDDLKKLSVFL